MRKKQLCALLLALVLVLSLSVPAMAEDAVPAAKPTVQETAQQLAELAAQYGQASALSYYVLGADGTYLAGNTGVYSKTENRALTKDAMYGIGSVSKMFTTTAIMQLVDKGKLNLDAPVTRYLPDFKMADPRYSKITVRMLLNHSAGLMGGSTYDAFMFNDPDQTATDDLLNRLSTQRLKSEPGEIAVYSNDGFTLAELVVEAVSGKDFKAYLRDEICRSSLSHTFTPQDLQDQSNLVKTYQTPDSTRALAADTLGVVGCGGIYASAMDLAQFGVQLTDGSLLSKASQDAMANDEYKRGIWPQDDTDSIAYGLGWDSVKVYPFATAGIQALAKGGDTLYYHAALVVIPEYKLAAAVLSSGGVSTYNQMAAAQMLAAVLAEKGVQVDQTLPAPATSDAAPMPAGLMQYSGYYGNLMQQLQIAVTADGKLTLHFTSDPSIPDQVLTYRADGTFRDPSGQAIVRFVNEENGLVYLYQKTVSPVPGLGFMPMSQYIAQKLPANELTQEVKTSWDAMQKMPYLPVNMKYTSQIYLSLTSGAPGATPETIDGYVSGLRIVDALTAQSIYQIPNMMGRDSQDLQRYTENGVDFYRNTQGLIYREYSDLKDIYAGGKAICTIGDDGYARWYSIGEADVGKTMKVSVSGKGGFTAYDDNGAAIASTAAYADTSAVLSQGGLVVFAGEPGTRFTLNFTK